MRCDWCEGELPEGYVPAVDYTGQPLAPTCRRCEVGLVFSRAKRLNLYRHSDTPASVGGKETQA